MKIFRLKLLQILWMLVCVAFNANAQLTPYEIKGKNYSATYEECIEFYKDLDKKYPSVSIHTMGMTDAGEPLHVVFVSSAGRSKPEQWHRNNDIVILINNGIHPGEPDGIDASMMLARDAALQIEKDEFPSNIILAIIPVYNIGGCLLRSEFNRVDQNGPESFGARGNSQNLDLNRDFIKCDSKEARSFAELFHWINPNIFIDNHVSDGADYQHIMTLAATQHNKLGDVMGEYLKGVFEPALFKRMKEKNYPMIPYANVWGKDPKEGWNQFFDGPRYSSGYASLFNVFAFTIETHMLKPYDQRVDATYKLMQTIIDYSSLHADTIQLLRKHSNENVLKQKVFPIAWANDETQFSEIEFQGYNYKTTISKVSGLPVKYYDKNEPYTKRIKFYNTYKPAITIDAPQAYIIPQGWWKVIELLKLNEVEMMQFNERNSVDVEAYSIKNYKSGASQYEGHHSNNKVEVEKNILKIDVRKGDYYIPVQQKNKRFLIEVLEPHASDSYFAWNYFDAILTQKEGYSDYAYEEYAATYLDEHPEIKLLLKEKCNTDTAFANDASAQLEFVYRHSPYVEPRHNLYPVYRVNDTKAIDILTPLINIEGGFRNKEDE